MNPYLFFLLLLLLSSCANKETKKVVVINKVIVDSASDNNIVYSNVMFNPELKKIDNDTLGMLKYRTVKDDWFFSDDDGICNLSNDTIFIKMQRGYWHIHNLEIIISNGKFTVNL